MVFISQLLEMFKITNWPTLQFSLFLFNKTFNILLLLLLIYLPNIRDLLHTRCPEVLGQLMMPTEVEWIKLWPVSVEQFTDDGFVELITGVDVEIEQMGHCTGVHPRLHCLNGDGLLIGFERCYDKLRIKW